MSIIIVPGAVIEILAHKSFGEERWVRYTVSDWETPRVNDRGQWLFHARSEYSDSPCPMMVESARIRAATPKKEGTK